MVKGTDHDGKITFTGMLAILQQSYPCMFCFRFVEDMSVLRDEYVSPGLEELVKKYRIQKGASAALGFNVTMLRADTEEGSTPLQTPLHVARHNDDSEEENEGNEEQYSSEAISASGVRDRLGVARDRAAAKKEKQIRFSRYNMAFQEAMARWQDENDDATLEQVCKSVNEKHLKPGDRLVYPTTVRTAIRKGSKGPMKKGPQPKISDDLLALLNCHIQLMEFTSSSVDMLHARNTLMEAIWGTRYEEINYLIPFQHFVFIQCSFIHALICTFFFEIKKVRRGSQNLHCVDAISTEIPRSLVAVERRKRSSCG